MSAHDNPRYRVPDNLKHYGYGIERAHDAHIKGFITIEELDLCVRGINFISSSGTLLNHSTPKRNGKVEILTKNRMDLKAANKLLEL